MLRGGCQREGGGRGHSAKGDGLELTLLYTQKGGGGQGGEGGRSHTCLLPARCTCTAGGGGCCQRERGGERLHDAKGMGLNWRSWEGGGGMKNGRSHI
jgi:hypothetical protein